MNRAIREVYAEMTHAERQGQRRARLQEIQRELSDAHAVIAAQEALVRELNDERRQINAALLESAT